jgi:molecular chaperone HscB
MRFFDFFDLPVSFLLDEDALRRAYLAKSKQFHPDFFTLESDEVQAEVLKNSSLNNEAYRTLSNFDQRMKYILEEKGLLVEGQNEIPKNFLMDMMDLNEALAELEFDFDPHTYTKLNQELASLESELLEEVTPALQHFSGNTEEASSLEKIKNFYLKKRYLLRVKENLSTFAHR